MALLLAVARRIPFNDRFVRAGRWPKEGDPALSNSLAGRRVGIVGLGRIGRRVAELAEAFGMVVCYTGPRRKDDVAWRYYGDLVELAREVDCLIADLQGRARHRPPDRPRGDRGARARGLADQRVARIGGGRAGPGRRLGARPPRRRRAGRVRERAAACPRLCSASTMWCCSRTRPAPARRRARPWANWCSTTSPPISPAVPCSLR